MFKKSSNNTYNSHSALKQILHCVPMLTPTFPRKYEHREKKKHNVLVGFSFSSPMKILKSHDLPLDDKFCSETQYFCISTVRHCSAAAKASIQRRKCDWVSELGLFGFFWGLFVFAKTAPQHRLLGCFRHLSDKSENFLF